jgi:tripartite-type tricarboxylate transporter receptor subunit TctC
MAYPNIARRRLLAGMAAASSLATYSKVWGQAFPSKNIRVVIPTAQGGGADRLARTFDDFWGPLLKTKFEYSFHPGAAGQVGYELYIQKRERDGHNLLFGNMGPEMLMYALQRPSYRFPEDYQYFCRVDVDDSILFVSRKSPFKRIEDVVEAAKKKTVTVAVSRLPHPASIGMLALGDATKARFNLIPYGGGNPTMVNVMNGEADCGALPTGGIVAAPDKFKVLGVFNDKNSLAKYTENAPSVNAVFGTKIPPLYSARAWAVHTEVIEKHKDRFALLEKTARQVFDNPAYKAAFEKTGAPVENSQFGDRNECTRYAKGMLELANEYRSLLTAKKEK